MLQAVALGELSDVAAGRAAIGESLQLVEYTPQAGDAWDDMRGRHKRLEAATLGV